MLCPKDESPGLGMVAQEARALSLRASHRTVWVLHLKPSQPGFLGRAANSKS